MPRRYQQQHPKTVIKRAAIWLLRLAFLLAAPELLAQEASEAPAAYVISERVGVVLDAEERTYFGFFPRLEGFESAAIHAPTDTTVAFAIARQGHPDTTVVASREAAEALRDYVDLYEQIFDFDGAEQIEQWGLVVPFVQPVKPYREGRRLSITTVTGEKMAGRLLYATEDIVVLSQADTRMGRLTRADEAVVPFPREVQHVRGRSPFAGAFSNALNIPWAGNDSLYANYTLSTLRRSTAFVAGPSPEIRAAIRRKQNASTPPAEPVPFDQARLRRLTHRLHVSLSYSGLRLAQVPSSYLRFPITQHTPDGETRAVPSAERQVTLPKLLFSLRAGYSLTKHVRLEGQFQRLREAIPYHQVETFNRGVGRDVRAHASGSVVSGLVSYTFNPVSRLDFLYGRSFWSLRNAEVRIGTGLGYALQSAETELISRDYVPHFAPREVYHSRSNALGGAFVLDADFYPARSFSFGLTFNTLVFPRFLVDAVELPENPVRAWPVTLGGGHSLVALIDLALGFRFHL
ncbi:MAG: hypothetical protein ACR2GR_09225 [Rhodothermales bacterium]